MTAPTDPDVPSKPQPGASEPDLDAAFRKWQLSPAPTAEELRQPHEERAELEYNDPHLQLVRLKRGRALRTLVFVSLLGLTLFSVWKGRSELAYAFSSSQPIDLGHVALAFATGVPDPEALPNNRYVTVDGLLVTGESEAGKHAYFMCPLYGIIVQTKRALPEEPVATQAYLEVDSKFVPLLEKRKAFPQDLTEFFQVKGRLIRYDSAPAWSRPVGEFYQNVLPGRLQDAWFLADDEAPGDYIWYVVALAVALGGCGLAGWLAMRTLRAERALERALGR
jgi:hypothetical protein